MTTSVKDENDLCMSMIAKLASTRRAIGMTGKELSAKSGVSLMFLYSLLRGEHDGVSLRTFIRICQAMDVTIKLSGTSSDQVSSDPGESLTVREAAERLGVARQRMYVLIKTYGLCTSRNSRFKKVIPVREIERLEQLRRDSVADDSQSAP